MTRGGLARTFAVSALAAIVVFVGTCATAEVVRTDYNWIGMPLSFYAIGPFGCEVRIAFAVLAVGLVLRAAAWQLASAPAARSLVPTGLFTVAAIALLITAVATTDPLHARPTLHGDIHALATAVAFLGATLGILVESWQWRHDPRQRKCAPLAFGWAVVTFVALWIAGLCHPVSRGLDEKVVVILILTWLWASAWRTARLGACGGVAPGACCGGRP